MINNRYTILKKLGEGRSKVFLCTDNSNPETQYAIKILSENADTTEVKTFRKEYFILQHLNHPNIIASHDEGTIIKTDDEKEIYTGSRFIILDYFPGTELLKYENLNDEPTLRIILHQICSVLYYLHQSNYIYYDLKPENILVGESGGRPFIKLIDMGFAHHLSSKDNFTARGTREYIAPEILKDEMHNHQADLYSLGILMYKIIYGKFPFSSAAEIEIYKEQIEKEFEFPESSFSAELISITQKLLEKNPVDRYDNSLQILKSIETKIDFEFVKHFTPAAIFADRVEIISRIEKFIVNNKEKKVIILSGAEGSGKTTLLYKIYSDYDKVILIGNAGRRNGISFIQYLLNKIIFQEFVYQYLDNVLIEKIELVLSGSSNNLIDNLKSIFTGISSIAKFNIIIDDFNLLDEFTLDIFSEILPIIQVNGINIILSERADHTEAAEKIIKKIIKINLSPFTDNDLTEYLDKAFATFFPRDQLKNLVVKYADLLPGSIINFIRDLILLKIIRFTYDGAEIIEDNNTGKLLESSQDEIFKLRFSLLSYDELKTVQFISAFGNIPVPTLVAGYNNFTTQEINEILHRLEEKNILQISNVENSVNFTSDSLKKYAYTTIENSKAFHLKIAMYISDNIKEFSRNELARHYELGEKYISSYEILLNEIDEADRLSAYSYKKNVLDHLLKLPLPEDYKFQLKYKLTFTLNRLNDPRSTLNLVEELLTNSEDEAITNELLILKGMCLTELGELEEGKNLLEQMVEKISDNERKQKIMVEIAYSEFDLGNYDIAKKICDGIINSETSNEEKGKCYNLLGLINTFLKNDLDGALNNFQEALKMYQEANLKLNVAKMEGNIGNTYNRKEDYKNAEIHWNNSLQINVSIGNLDQEARLLLSFGILYYNIANFEKSIEQYTRAYNIFSSLGNRNGQGLALTNLGEVFISGCEYQKAFESLKEAKSIFEELAGIEDEAEVIFMLGKLFNTVGDEKQLANLILEFEKLLSENQLPERYSNNFKFLEQVSLLQGLKRKIDFDNLENITDLFKDQNEGAFFAEGIIMLSDLLIQMGEYEFSFKLMKEDKFEKICRENLIYKTVRNYFLSQLSLYTDIYELPSSIKFLEEAHKIIVEEHITEYTWKILFSLGKNYFERGNIIKANEYLIYSKEVINFIANNINDNNLKTKYLSKQERKAVLEEIENMLIK